MADLGTTGGATGLALLRGEGRGGGTKDDVGAPGEEEGNGGGGLEALESELGLTGGGNGGGLFLEGEKRLTGEVYSCGGK